MATKKQAKPAAGPDNKGLQVTARSNSFWRGGRQFTREPQVVPLADLTPEQLDEILAEGDGGELVVIEVDIDPSATGNA